MKKWFISISGVLGLILVIIAVLISTDAWSFEPTEAFEEAHFSASDINSIHIFSNVGNVTVMPHQGEEIVASVSGHTRMFEEELEFETKESGAVLSIHAEQKDRAWLFSFLPKSSYAITVRIPETEMEELVIKSSVANLSVLDVEVEQMTLKSEVGDVELSGAPKLLEIETDVGNINAKVQSIYESMKLLSSVGDIMLTVAELPDQLEYTVHTSVGSTAIEPLESVIQTEAAPVLKMETSVGSIEVLSGR